MVTEQKTEKKKLFRKKNLIYIIGIAFLIAAVAAIIISWCLTKDLPDDTDEAASIDNSLVINEAGTLLSEQTVIKTGVIEDSLRDMGVLVSEDYFFTEVVSYSSVKHLFNTDIALGFTESNYLIQYDGEVHAGCDFSKIRVDVSEKAKKITVVLPKASIIGTEIDQDSFKCISEKSSIWNPVSVTDYNSSMTELKKTAEEKALSRGILESADENAKKIITNFLAGLPGIEEYHTECIVK